MASIQRITAAPPLPPRPVDGHKGTFGRVLVVGGQEGMIGAPVFAGTAALRMGSGLVQLAIPRAILSACLSITPELIGVSLGATARQSSLLEAAEKADALVIGPGFGNTPLTRARLAILIKLKKPAVLDADALNILAAGRRWPAGFKLQAVLTPHPGEMARLGKLMGTSKVPTDDDGRIALAVKAANAFGQVIVLKGHRTVVTDGRRVYVNTTGNSALSKAGTGDVLSGMIGSLLGQKLDRFDAACIGVKLHGIAGEIAGADWGLRGALARDVIEAIPDAAEESA